MKIITISQHYRMKQTLYTYKTFFHFLYEQQRLKNITPKNQLPYFPKRTPHPSLCFYLTITIYIFFHSHSFRRIGINLFLDRSTIATYFFLGAGFAAVFAAGELAAAFFAGAAAALALYLYLYYLIFIGKLY